VLKGLKRVVYQVPDINKGKQWYREIIGKDPVFDAPFGVVFAIDGFELVLAPHVSAKAGKNGNVIAYWGVDDVEFAYNRLKELGATHHSEINTVNGTRVASVFDPFGNVLGIKGTEADRSRASIEHRPSDSAQMVACIRALAALDEREGIRCKDYLAEKFITAEQRNALQSTAIKGWLMQNPPGMYQYTIARTVFFDQAVEDALQEGVPQLVFLGAGYDSRPYRFRHLLRDTRIFELDALRTQQRKRETLQKAGISVPSQVTFVPINFHTEDLKEVLGRVGYKEDKKTLFIWEGVTFYLTPGAVDSTLRFIKNNSRAGSAVCFDCAIASRDGRTGYGVKEMQEAVRVSFPGEAVQFAVEDGHMALFLSERGFGLIEYLNVHDMERKYLTLPDGTSAGRVTEMFNFVRAEVS
jgi:methyltransferase (TIGR00027 family)